MTQSDDEAKIYITTFSRTPAREPVIAAVDLFVSFFSDSKHWTVYVELNASTLPYERTLRHLQRRNRRYGYILIHKLVIRASLNTGDQQSAGHSKGQVGVMADAHVVLALHAYRLLFSIHTL